MDQGADDDVMDTSLELYRDSYDAMDTGTPQNPEDMMDISQDNVKPNEDGRTIKPDDTANISVAPVCSGFASHHSSTGHSVPDLTVVLFGSSDAVKFGCDNILLGEKQLPMIIPLEKKISEHHVSVVNMIGSHETELKLLHPIIGQLLKENQIHAFIFVVRLGQLTDEDKFGIEWLQRVFGDRVLPFVIVLFTYEREDECDSIIDDLKKNSVLEQLLEKCGGRYHTCSKNMNNQSEIRELMDRISRLFDDNHQQGFTRDMYSSSTDLQNRKYGSETGVSTSETNTQPLGNLVQTNEGEDLQKTYSLIMDQGADDVVMDTGTHQNPEDMMDNPHVTNQEVDDVLIHTPATKQYPDDMMDKPPVTNYEKYAENLYRYKPVLTDATTNVEFHIEPASFKAGECKDNVKPNEDGHTMKPDDTANISVASVCSGFASHHSSTGAETEVSRSETNTQPLGTIVQTDKGDQQKLDAKQLIVKIHLEDEGLNLRTVDFLKPTVQSQSSDSCAEEEVASVFLQKLLMMDYRARCIKIKQNNQHHTQQKKCDSYEGLDDDFDLFFGETDKTPDGTESDAVHLMDVQMAVFHCADGLLKQLIVTKLSQCQYALPLLVPNPFTQQIEFPLWTFRQINKTWKTTDDKGQILSKFQPVYKAETPMVAFFRFGALSSSKSELMNNLINEKHNTFFHRNCPGSSRTRVMMDGVVEIAWYCPSAKETDKFTDCVAFCNLHGDAGDNEKQLEILTEMATVNVAILPKIDKNDKKIQNFFRDSKPLICLLTENDSGLREIRGKYKIGLKDRNKSDVYEEIRKAINNVLTSKLSYTFKIEDVAKPSFIRVDEDNVEDCMRGNKAARQMMSLLEQKDLTKIKESFLPLQGKLWHQWCQKNKELHRPALGELHKGSSIEKNKSLKLSEMQKIRELQRTSESNEFIQMFIQKLESPEGKEVAYFLKWLGILLDDYTTESLSTFLLEYDGKWSTVLNLKKHHKSQQLTEHESQQLKAAQEELEKISEKLQAATFGLEHILREIGQIYESCSSVKKNQKDLKFNFSSLPNLAAEMMISGFPLELMDGDAAHVPLIWVTAVLDSLIQKLGDKRVYVLSVLGIQSSGKSTMLNAMFGLQFAVSAGRCTRGAFMQLVKVSEEMKKLLKFDYILVVDTEGLRALELAGRSTRNHDNEMATFVVGLGNMTLINIFGENTAEMQDILQIVVQAFMRMKKIRLNPSCIFVHQNVSDVSAGEKNMEGRRRLQDKLDEMTKLAAKEEDCDTQFFSDVIAFDVQKDVKYFAQLWEGSPPMAPPNPDYSRNIQELKDTVLSKASESSGMTFSQFKMRINDLWNALLNENFVFSFRNTLEIAVYRKLETKYSEWTWSLRSAMLSIEGKFYNRIANGSINVQEKDLLAEMRQTKEEVEKSIQSYFEEDKDKDILCQWRGRFETRIKDLHDDLVKGTKRKLDEAIEQKKAREKLDQRKREYENELFIRSKELALNLRNTGTDENLLNKEFDKMWSKWVTEMTKDVSSIKDFNFWEDVTQLLNENNELGFVNERFNQKRYEQIDCCRDYCDYMIPKTHLERSDETKSEESGCNAEKGNSGIMKWIGKKIISGIKHFTGTSTPQRYTGQYPEIHYSIRDLTLQIIQETEKIMKKSPVATRGYNNSFVQEITDCVKTLVKQHQKNGQKYTLKKEFTIDLSLYVCDIAKQKFTELHNKFKEENDPKIYLEKQKTQYWNIFEKCFIGATTTTILSEFICSKLELSILQAVYNETAITLATQMRSNIEALRENRPNLEKHILKSLAEKENFGAYIKYIHNPREYFKQFIKDEVERYFTEQNQTILNTFKGKLKGKEDIVTNAVKAATVKVKGQGGDGNMWFRCFTENLTDELTGNSCVDLKDIKDLDFLEKLLSDSLKKGMTKLEKSFTCIDDIKMENCRKRPEEILIEHFCQCCWVQCPFCKAICTNTMEDHPGDHSVAFHRNMGLNGWSYRGTTNLALDFCTTAVASDRCFYPCSLDTGVPLNEYRKGGPDYANWSITHDTSELPYWKWVVCRFKEDLEKYYENTYEESGEIPDEWREYTKKDALESVDKYM